MLCTRKAEEDGEKWVECRVRVRKTPPTSVVWTIGSPFPFVGWQLVPAALLAQAQEATSSGNNSLHFKNSHLWILSFKRGYFVKPYFFVVEFWSFGLNCFMTKWALDFICKFPSLHKWGLTELTDFTFSFLELHMLNYFSQQSSELISLPRVHMIGWL